MIDGILSLFARKPAEERAFIIIRGFFDTAERIWNAGDVIPEKLAAEFHEWFFDPQNRSAKDKALKRIIELEDTEL